MKKLISLLLTAILCMMMLATAGADFGQAEQMGLSAVGRYATITQDGNIRAAASADAELVGRVSAWDQYQIMGMTRNTTDWHIWFLIEYQDGWYGWISANITTAGDYQYSLPGDGFIIITGETVHCRRGPGTDYSQVAYCVAGNGFRVLETRMGNTGKPWYRISVQGVSCWVSSGMCEYYGY